MAAIIIPGVLDPDPPPPSRARRTSLLWTAAVLGALVAVPFLLRLPLIERRGFDPDEFEHLHFAWRISRGDVTYRDYFDHHTPWLHFLLSRFFARYHVETSSA